MSQQELTAAPGAYPAPKASDLLFWHELGLVSAGDAPERCADAASEQQLMSRRAEKILLTTRLSWAAR